MEKYVKINYREKPGLRSIATIRKRHLLAEYHGSVSNNFSLE